MEGSSDTPPGAFPPPSSPVGPSGILAPLASALGQCLCIVLAGFLCRQWGLFSSTDAAGLSAFVGRCSLPALLFLAMVNLDIETMDWPILYTLASTKVAVFLGTVVCCRLALSDGKRRAILDEPIGLVRDSSIRSTLSGSTAADDCDECELNAAAARSPEAPSPWVCRAGLYAIFATQSNDFALGLPLFSAVWGPRFLPMIYVLAPVQLALLNLESPSEIGEIRLPCLRWHSLPSDCSRSHPSTAQRSTAFEAAANQTPSILSPPQSSRFKWLAAPTAMQTPKETLKHSAASRTTLQSRMSKST